MANENEIAEFRKNFLDNYANSEYRKYQAIRERVRDCVSGTATMKGIGGASRSGGGNDFAAVQKYLIPTRRQKKYPEEYLRYLMMADFPGYAETAALVALGLVSTGDDTIAGLERLPESLRGMNAPDSADHPRLRNLRIAINRAQMIDGGCVNFLEVAGPEALRNGAPPFFVNSYRLDKYVTAQLDPEKGSPFVLMDESDWVFDYRIKRNTYVNKYRLFAVDRRGDYYQAALTAEMWPSFDIAEPEPWDAGQEPPDPQFGRAYYPRFNDFFHEIPVDFCNVTQHDPYKYENPMLAPVADKDIIIFNCDAAYRQTLWLTSQPINVIYCDGKARNLTYGAGAVHNLPEGAREEWLEFSGAGAGAQRIALEDMHARAAQKAMSLIATGSDLSGEALKIIQGSQVAPLVSLVKTSGESITRMLHFAAAWAGVGEADLNEISYVPSEVFSRMNLSAGDILQLIQAKRSNPETPVLWSEIRRRLVESGIADEEIADFDELMTRIEAENEAYGTLETPTMRFGIGDGNGSGTAAG